jgi:hypothetical protein
MTQGKSLGTKIAILDERPPIARSLPSLSQEHMNLGSNMGTSVEEQIAQTMKLLGDPHVCGWSGCMKQLNGDEPPPGWVTLTLSKSPSQRQVVLSPMHRAELEGQLKGLGETGGGY